MLSEEEGNMVPNVARKMAFNSYNFEKYGFLGKLNRIKFLHYVLEEIRKGRPDDVMS